MFLYIFCPHSVQYELSFIGHSHDVIPGGMGQQPRKIGYTVYIQRNETIIRILYKSQSQRYNSS
jgi:hypothetical protein